MNIYVHSLILKLKFFFQYSGFFLKNRNDLSSMPKETKLKLKLTRTRNETTRPAMKV